MKYITGIHALNIEDSLETCGDWHTSALNWQSIELNESEDNIFGDWGIEKGKEIPEHTELYNVANTLRAILDLMIKGSTRYLKGFRDDFMCTDKYNREFFEEVMKLRGLSNWGDINTLMKQEFMYEWDRYVEEMSNGLENNAIRI